MEKKATHSPSPNSFSSYVRKVKSLEVTQKRSEFTKEVRVNNLYYNCRESKKGDGEREREKEIRLVEAWKGERWAFDCKKGV